MIDQDRSSKETMLRNTEASAGCLRTNIPYNLHGGVNVIQELSKVMDAPNIHSGRSLVESGNSSVRQGFMPQNEGYNSPFNSQEFHMFSPYYSEFQKSSQNQWSVSGNIVYPLAGEYFFPIDNIVPYMPFQMISPTYMQGFPSQEFTYFVVIDFEATCDKDRNLHPQEIIEFPSVLVNSLTGKLEASFQTYVRPAYHQHLTDFCKELTGIQQIQVDRGVPLGDALLSHDKWLEAKGIKHTKFAVVTWGDWDCRVMLESECKFKSIRKPPYFNSWINLKILFQEVFGGVRCNLKEAVQMAGLIWEGRPHCGLDDALNTARLLSLLMSRGIRFSITNSLTQQSNDCPIPCVPCTNGTLAIPASQHEKSNLQQQQLVGLTNAFKIHQRHLDPTSKEARTYCFCGAMTSKRMIRKPGPKQGMFFFGCGNWTTARGAMCNYFEWAS